MSTPCPNCTGIDHSKSKSDPIRGLNGAQPSHNASRSVVDYTPDLSSSYDSGYQHGDAHHPPALLEHPVTGRDKLQFEHSLASSEWIDLGLVPIYPVSGDARKSHVNHARARSLPPRRQSVTLGAPHDTTQYRYHLGTLAHAQYWFTSAPDPSLHSPKPLSEGLYQRRQSSLSISSGASWLCLYFILNLTLTIFNKVVLVHFPFPYLLTATHALFGTIGCLLLVVNSVFAPSPLSTPQRVQLLAFSVLYTTNILISNISLQLVTVTFHQVVRSAMPLFTITISYGLLGTRVTLMTFLSLVPVIVGVCLTTLGDISFTRWGLILTLLGTFLAALKGVYTSLLQADPQRPRSHSLESQTPGLIEKGYSEDAMVSAPVTAKKSLDSLDLLYRMSPLALVQCVFYAIVTGELSDIRRNICLWDCPSQRFFASVGTPRDIIGPREIAILALNAVLAFALNYVSFTVNRKAGALGMTVAANVKQVLALILAIVLFDFTVTPLNLLGIILTLAGGACYAAVEYKQKNLPSTNQHPSGSNAWQIHR